LMTEKESLFFSDKRGVKTLKDKKKKKSRGQEGKRKKGRTRPHFSLEKARKQGVPNDWKNRSSAQGKKKKVDSCGEREKNGDAEGGKSGSSLGRDGKPKKNLVMGNPPLRFRPEVRPEEEHGEGLNLRQKKRKRKTQGPAYFLSKEAGKGSQRKVCKGENKICQIRGKQRGCLLSATEMHPTKTRSPPKRGGEEGVVRGVRHKRKKGKASR